MYAYCGNNPVYRKDDSGEFWHLVIGGIVGAVIGGVSAALSGGDWVDVFIGAAAGAASGVLVASGAGIIAQAIGGAAISMASNAAQQINDIVSDKSGNTKFSVADMAFDGAVGLACGIIGGNGASYGNTAGINASWKQLLKRGLSNKSAQSYFAKTAHNAEKKFVLTALKNGLVINAGGAGISVAKTTLVRWLS